MKNKFNRSWIINGVMILKNAILFLLLLSSNSICQSDTLDTIILQGEKTIIGKVLIIKTDVVVFVEESTSVTYEYDKSKINSIILSSGQIIEFNKSTTLDKKGEVLVEEQEKDTKSVWFGIGGGALFSFECENYEYGTGGDLFFELRTGSIFSVRANIGWYSADTKVNYLKMGNASFILMELSLLIRAMSGIIQPYGGLGISYYSIDNSISNAAKQYYMSQYDFGIRQEIEDGIGFHIRGGFDLIFASGVGLFLDLKYLIMSPKATTIVYELNNPSQEWDGSDDIKINNLNLILGVVITF